MRITEIAKENLGGAARLVPDNQETSESEEDDSEEENKKSVCVSGEGPEDLVGGCEERPNADKESVVEAASSPATEISAVSNGMLAHELPVESESSLPVGEKPLCTGSTTKNMFDDEEVNQRHEEDLCKSSSLKIKNDSRCIPEAEYNGKGNGLLSSTESKLKSTCEPDVEAEQLHLNGEGNEVSLCHNSEVRYSVPDSNTDNKRAVKPEENCSNSWAFFSINLSTEELQQGFDTQVSPSWSEDNFVGEQRQKKVRKPKQMSTNVSTELNCPQSCEGLVKEDPQGMVTEEAGNNVQSNGQLAPAPGEVRVGLLVKPRSTSTQRSVEVNASRSDAAPVAPKRKRYRRIVNLAPKFNQPREIAGGREREEEVLLKGDGPSGSVLDVEQKGFLCQDRGLGPEQNLVFQEYAAPYSGPEAPCSLPTPDVDSPLRDISYFHLGQSSPMPKNSCSVCVISRTKEERAHAPKQQQAVDDQEGESEQTSSDVISSQPDILSSVKAVSEYSEGLSVVESCAANVHEADGPEPSEASPPEFKQDVNMKATFLGLPLSIGFAFQLVQLFGSPGLPLESLLPDDYVVPLDWKVSKMIYLLWKTSVEVRILGAFRRLSNSPGVKRNHSVREARCYSANKASLFFNIHNEEMDALCVLLDISRTTSVP
ncbi:UNVERIFIED_CONTAM: hypothetical protein H355_001641 [Colinus virginianus]|nr:hypothetical protein H355_001641 [Colinus virginianus]